MMRSTKWLVLLALFGLGAAGCIPGGGGGGGSDDGGDPGDVFIDPDDGIPPVDMFVDPDDGIPPADMFVDPDDGVPPLDRGVETDRGDCGPERCNGEDDDCDGAIDEGFGGLGEPCSIGLGLCEADGRVVCTPDGRGTVCDAVAPAPAEEMCNGLDDDCDGETDEAVGPVPCATGAPGRCAAGLEQCVGGEALCVPQLDARRETCDGEDDDCDGAIDEGQGGGECATGEPGRCALGVLACIEGDTICQGPDPVGERCSAEDDDCDGRVDEGGVCDACAGVECPRGSFCQDGECVEADPCEGVACPPGMMCDAGACVPVDPGDAIPIARMGQSITIDGALTADDPLWRRLDQSCVGRRNTDYHYDAVRVINLTGAPAMITTTGDWVEVDGYLHVFADPFDPVVDAGCLGGDDDFGMGTGQSQVPNIVIAPGQVRVLVPSTYGAGEVMDYTLTVETVPCVGDPACDAVEPLGAECEDYFELDDLARNIDQPNTRLCDRLNRGSTVDFGSWHRFVPPAGTRMPEAAPATNTCGTDAPGWLFTDHPAVGDGIVDGVVCFHWADDPCNWSVDIEVRNCGDFYVYRLPEAPFCTLAYCGQ